MKTVHFIALLFLLGASVHAEPVLNDDSWLPGASGWTVKNGYLDVYTWPPSITSHPMTFQIKGKKVDDIKLRKGDSYTVKNRNYSYTTKVTLLSLDRDSLRIRVEDIYPNLPFGFGSKTKTREFNTPKEMLLEF